jgi:hypothetical protein
MKCRHILIFLVMTMLPSYCLSRGREINYNSIFQRAINDQFVEYYAKGDSIPKEGTPFIAIVDTLNQSIEVTTRSVDLRDSMYYQFIPGDRIAFWISAVVSWDENSQSLVYKYELTSDTSSLVPIWMLSLEWTHEVAEMITPKGWYVSPLGEAYTWSPFDRADCIKPGESLKGIGLRSGCPPLLGNAEIRGQETVISEKGINDYTGDIFYGISGEHLFVEDKTIVPGLCPESIVPPEWVDKIISALRQLRNTGYMGNDQMNNIRWLLIDLREILKNPDEQTIEQLEEHVNNTLTELEQYEDEIEPEAYGYITENLRHMLRNKDIIHFETW